MKTWRVHGVFLDIAELLLTFEDDRLILLEDSPPLIQTMPANNLLAYFTQSASEASPPTSPEPAHENPRSSALVNIQSDVIHIVSEESPESFSESASPLSSALATPRAPH
jgi:hypothetical protein